MSTTQNDIIRRSEGLLEAVDRSPDVQQEVQKERLALHDSLVEVKTLKARQEELTAQRQEVTQQFNAAMARLKDAGLVFRALIKAKLGVRNERLVQYNVAPLRKRSRGRLIVVEKTVEEKPVNGKPAETDSPSAKPVA